MSKDLAKLFAKHFIARSDVKAIQLSRAGGGLQQGDWFPDTRIKEERLATSPHAPRGFNMDHLLAHLAGERTYGHYLLNENNECKMFAFDIDLEKGGTTVKQPDLSQMPEDLMGNTDPAAQEKWYHDNAVTEIVDGKSARTLRDVWTDRSREAAPHRAWLKMQMKQLGHMFASKLVELEIPCAVAYSGSKGIHVYGFTGLVPAAEARQGAMLVMDMIDEFDPARGDNFFKHRNPDPFHGFQNFSIEVFPKQDSLEGKSLGNLMRLPLGTNWKNPKDPTFFVDMTTPMAEFKPVADPVKAIEGGNPFVG